jgi:diguanylate cyclase (GGDEF)-like protein
MLLRLAGFAALMAHPRARHLLVACGFIVGLALAAGVTILLVASRNDALDHAGQNLKNLSLVLAEETDRTFQTAQLVQLDLIQHLHEQGIDTVQKFEQDLESRLVNLDLRRRIATAPQIGSLVLISRFGDVINASSQWPVSPANVRDHAYFRRLAEDPGRETVIGRPEKDPGTGMWSIVIASPFTALDGRLLGIVSTSIQLDLFERFFARISGQGDPSYALFRLDGMLLARFPRVDAMIGRAYGNTPNFHREVAGLDRSVLLETSMLDVAQRLVAPHSVAHFPMFIAATNNVNAVLSGWRLQARSLVAATTLIELFVAGIVVLGVRQLRGQERVAAANAAALRAETARAWAESELILARQREAAEHAAYMQSQRFDLALSNMQQGLAMFDNADRLMVANRRFYQLVGATADAFPPNITAAGLMELAVAHGGFTHEDMEALHRWRKTAAVMSAEASSTFEMTNGQSMVMTYQPMADGWLATYEDITERRDAQHTMAHMARHDALTDLPNRVLFREKMEEALTHARRGHSMALLCLDLDQFKTVNDTLGHPVGDALLVAVARRLTEHVRDTDTVARVGGDEFAVVQAPIDKPTEAADFADRLIAMLDTPFEVDGHQIVIGTSIGVVFAPQDGLDADQLLKNADLALYRAKSDDRGVYRLFHTGMDAEMQERRLLELDLRQALRSGQFEVFYQPLVALRTQAMSGFEALLRWHHPERGMVSPAMFIPLAEEIGAIVPIGEWVLRQACAAAASWDGTLRVSVNLSPVQFKSRNLVASVAAALREARLAPARLELEITETVMLQDTEATLATLHELRNLGVSISMDDFGTGYSSLSYLRRFPFDRIKIDQSFVREIDRQHDCGAIIRAVIALSREFGMATTAEGVETREQLCALAQAGCSDIQGYLFSRPVPLGDIPAMLRSMPLVADLLAHANLAAGRDSAVALHTGEIGGMSRTARSDAPARSTLTVMPARAAAASAPASYAPATSIPASYAAAMP